MSGPLIPGIEVPLADGSVLVAVAWCVLELRSLRRKVDELLAWRQRHDDLEERRRRS